MTPVFVEKPWLDPGLLIKFMDVTLNVYVTHKISLSKDGDRAEEGCQLEQKGEVKRGAELPKIEEKKVVQNFPRHKSFILF